MRENHFFAFLQLFAEGGGAEGAGGTAADAGQREGVAEPEIFYGKPEPEAQDPAAQNEQPEQKPDRKAAFKALIKGEFKAEFDEYMQKTVGGRVKNLQKELDRYHRYDPVIAGLGERYHMDGSDPDALNEAFKKDKALYEAEALELGMDPEAYLDYKLTKVQNRMFQAREDELAMQAQADADARRWFAEGESVKAEFPQFDIMEELENEEFRNMLKAGVGVRSAFIAIHNGEIYPAAMQAAAADAREKTVAAIRAGMERPTENGMSRSAAATFKADPSTWTDADFDRVEEIVMRGGQVRL